MILMIFFQKHLNCFLIYFHFIVSFLLLAFAFLFFLNHQIYLIVFFEDYFQHSLRHLLLLRLDIMSSYPFLFLNINDKLYNNKKNVIYIIKICYMILILKKERLVIKEFQIIRINIVKLLVSIIMILKLKFKMSFNKNH
jgi:hypothetical protein